jgi:hypothetical protein
MNKTPDGPESLAEQGEPRVQEHGEDGLEGRGEASVNGRLKIPARRCYKTRESGVRMNAATGVSGRARLALTSAIALVLAGCMGSSGPSQTSAITTATTEASADPEAIDIRRYLGPDYCPELRIREGAQLVRRYEPGHIDDPAYVIWQASLGRTARECLYDLQGNLTLRIGVSGRVIAGPKGSPGTVSVPLGIVVEKYQEAELAAETLALSIDIPPGNSTTFSEVREITVPSPGTDRDYLIHVGFGEKAQGIVQEEPPPPKRVVRRVAPPAPQQPAAQPQTPDELPVPNVLPLPQGW